MNNAVPKNDIDGHTLTNKRMKTTEDDLATIVIMPAIREALKRGVHQDTLHRYFEIEMIQAGDDAEITLTWLCTLLDNLQYLPTGPNTLFSISQTHLFTGP